MRGACSKMSIWKKSTILPLYKKDNANLVTNYRPVSLLCCVSKLFEKIVYKYYYNHLRDLYFISPCQYGFLLNHSTVGQLAEMLHIINDDNSNGKETRLIFLDISKAFDRVWHKGLIYKMKHTGISDTILRWFTDYLSNRYQRVALKGCNSDWKSINCGVPQGSV